MNKRTMTLGLMAAAAITFGPGVSQAHAQDFAQVSAISFKFLNDGSTGVLKGNNDPNVGTASFDFLVANSYGAINAPINADFSFTAGVSGPAQTGSGLVDQPLSVSTFQIIARTPQGGKSNLLTITGATGDLTGFLGDNTGQTSGDTMLSNTLHFSSDFLNFATPDAGSFNLPLSGVDPGLTANNPDGYLDPFSAGGTGGFATSGSTTPAPEPGGLEASFVMLLVGGGMIAARRMRPMRNNPVY